MQAHRKAGLLSEPRRKELTRVFARVTDHDIFRPIMTETPIQIRNPDVVRDIRALADRLGLPMTEVVADAVRRRLDEELAEAKKVRSAAQRRVVDVLARIDALAVTGPVLTDDDLYGPDGLPR